MVLGAEKVKEVLLYYHGRLKVDFVSIQIPGVQRRSFYQYSRMLIFLDVMQVSDLARHLQNSILMGQDHSAGSDDRMPTRTFSLEPIIV